MCDQKNRVPAVMDQAEHDVEDLTSVLWEKTLAKYPELDAKTRGLRDAYGCIPIMWDVVPERLLRNCESSLRFLWIGVQILVRCWERVERARRNGETKGCVMEVNDWEAYDPRCPQPGDIWKEGEPWLEPPAQKNMKFVWCEEFAILEPRTEILRRGYWRKWGFVHPANIRLRENDTKLTRRDDSSAECFLKDLPSGLSGLDWVPVRGCLILIKVREYSVWRERSSLIASYWELRPRINIPDMWAPSCDNSRKRKHFYFRKFRRE